ncbi:MAG: universal stress protein [Acidimicrobiia bacterium]|nr:universal stress protein [Acidimicrobiia bacterium]MDH3396601.1 universal stress protein [Acidimicrobiia bacterium]
MEWPGWSPNVVVTATDGSDGSLRAAHVAASIAKNNAAKLYVITVVRPPEGWWGIGGAPPTATALANALDEAQHGVLDETTKDLDTEGIEVQTVEELGDPAATIIGFCTEIDADLLVVGKRGAGLIERFVMGSVADRLAHYAPCPVLMIP